MLTCFSSGSHYQDDEQAIEVSPGVASLFFSGGYDLLGGCCLLNWLPVQCSYLLKKGVLYGKVEPGSKEDNQ